MRGPNAARDWPVAGADLFGRCFLCGGVLRRGGVMRPCRLCGAEQAAATHEVTVRRRARLLVSLTPGRWAPPGGSRSAGWRVDDAALGMAAPLCGLMLRPDRASRARGGRAAGVLVPLRPSASRVTVVILARPGDEGAAVRAREAARFADAVLTVWDGEGEERRTGERREVFRPLSGDFGAQRNAAQALVETPWAFHLDSDERPDERLAAGLRRAVALAEATRARAVGFPRLNLVGGVPSRLFPDTQYRLVRREARFVGRVHERPAACADPSSTVQFLPGLLVHELDPARVARRKARYDAMGQAPAQAREATDLLTPFPTRAETR